MQLARVVRLSITMLAGLLAGSAMAVLTLSPSAMAGRVAWPLLVLALLLLIGATLRFRWPPPAVSRPARAPLPAPRPGDPADLAEIVTALDRLQRGHVTHGGGA